MQTAQKLVNLFSDQQTLPHVAIKVNELANSESSSMHDFEEIVKLDPVLVMRLLRLVNSSYFGLSNKVESITRAVAYLGLKALRNLVAVEAVKNFFKENDKNNGFSRKNLWIHSATVAILAQMIAIRIFGLKGDDVFLAGILHDIGMIVEDQVKGEELRQASDLYQKGDRTIISCERQTMETDHCEVGATLTKDWKLSAEVMDAIQKHHHDIRDASISSVTSIIQLAEFFATRMRFAVIPGRIAPLPSETLTRHVQEKISDYKIIARNLPDEMAKARELYDLN